MPFLTALDSRAQVKGSRDPLGVQPLWVGFGHKAVGNLTTASNSLRDFTTLILGFHLVRRAIEADPGQTPLNVFLRWEQLAAYSRFKENRAVQLRGIERVKLNYVEGKGRVPLSADREGQILSNQKIYGLWGLYTVPGGNSEVLDLDTYRLFPEAEAFVESVYLPVFKTCGLKAADMLVKLLCKRKSWVSLEGEHKDLAKALSLIYASKPRKEEIQFYQRFFVDGGPADSTGGKQPLLAKLLKSLPDPKKFEPSPKILGELIKGAERAPGGQGLALVLGEIQACESVIAISSLLFEHMLSLQGETLKKATEVVQKAWGKGPIKTVRAEAFAALRNEVERLSGEPGAGESWVAIAKAFAAGDISRVLEGLVQINNSVMKRRGNGPWITLEGPEKSIKVMYRDLAGRLLNKEELAGYWRHPYFIGSLNEIQNQLGGANG